MLIGLVFACKKEDNTTPKINISQNPKHIEVVDVNYGNPNHVNAQYAINYFYNDTEDRLDSIAYVNSNNQIIESFKFDYTTLASNHFVRINYSNATSPYYQLAIDSFYNRITTYTQFNNTTNFNLTFQYNQLNQLTQYHYTNNGFDCTVQQHYSYDTVYIKSQQNLPTCNNADTIITSAYDLSKRLPYFLFYKQNAFLHCAETVNAMPLLIKAMPISNNVYKLPYRATNGDVRSNYLYQYDENDRMTQALIVSISKSSLDTLNVVTYHISY